MARLLVFVLLAVFAVMLVRNWSRANSRRPGSDAPASEPIVRCEVCGLNVPQSEALTRGGLWYCSSEHLEHR